MRRTLKWNAALWPALNRRLVVLSAATLLLRRKERESKAQARSGATGS